MSIQFYRPKYDKSRFWELFIPTTNNLQFWLASSAFSFFIYQSLYKDVVVGVWEMIFRQFLAYAFVVFGFIFMGGMAYLFITWVFNIGIRKIKEKGRDGKSKR